MNLLKTACQTALFALIILNPIATATALTQGEMSYIDSWLQSHKLNPYGDPEGTMYLGGNPLYDETTGETMDRYEYVVAKHPRILDGYVSVLPVFDDPVAATAADPVTSKSYVNDFDAGRLTDRHLDEILRAEEENERLVLQMRESLDKGDYETLSALLDLVGEFEDARLASLASVLRDVRRMLSFETLQPIELTDAIAKLLVKVEKLQARVAA